MAQILYQIPQGQRANIDSKLLVRMLGLVLDEKKLTITDNGDIRYDFPSDQHISDPANNYASNVGVTWQGSATNVQEALDEILSLVYQGAVGANVYLDLGTYNMGADEAFAFTTDGTVSGSVLSEGEQMLYQIRIEDTSLPGSPAVAQGLFILGSTNVGAENSLVLNWSYDNIAHTYGSGNTGWYFTEGSEGQGSFSFAMRSGVLRNGVRVRLAVLGGNDSTLGIQSLVSKTQLGASEIPLLSQISGYWTQPGAESPLQPVNSSVGVLVGKDHFEPRSQNEFDNAMESALAFAITVREPLFDVDFNSLLITSPKYLYGIGFDTPVMAASETWSIGAPLRFNGSGVPSVVKEPSLTINPAVGGSTVNFPQAPLFARVLEITEDLFVDAGSPLIYEELIDNGFTLSGNIEKKRFESSDDAPIYVSTPDELLSVWENPENRTIFITKTITFNANVVVSTGGSHSMYGAKVVFGLDATFNNFSMSFHNEVEALPPSAHVFNGSASLRFKRITTDVGNITYTGSPTMVFEECIGAPEITGASIVTWDSTYKNLDDWMDHEGSPDIVEGGLLTDKSNPAAVVFSAGTARVRAGSGHLLEAPFPQAVLDLSAEAIYFIYAEYNNTLKYAELKITNSFEFILGNDLPVTAHLTNDGTQIYYNDLGESMFEYGFSNAKKDAQVYGFEYAAGAAPGLIATGNPDNFQLNISDHRMYLLNKPLDVPAVNTSLPANVVYERYRDGAGGWVRNNAVTELRANLYDNNQVAGLVEAANNKYINWFVFILYNTPSKWCIFPGQAEYDSLADAVAAGLPSMRPVELSSTSNGDEIYKLTFENLPGGAVLRDTQNLKSVVGQGAVTGGYVDLVSNQIIDGVKSFLEKIRLLTYTNTTPQSGDLWNDGTRVNLQSILRIFQNATGLILNGIDHVYMSFHPTGGARQAYFGFASPSSGKMTLMNENADTLAFGTSGSEQVFIDADGTMRILNVPTGTPAKNLSVDSSGKIIESSSTAVDGGIRSMDMASIAGYDLPTTDQVYYVRTYCTMDCVANSLGFIVQTGGTHTIDVGVYSDAGAKLADGQVTSTATGINIASLSTQVTLTAGDHFWLALKVDSGSPSILYDTMFSSSEVCREGNNAVGLPTSMPTNASTKGYYLFTQP